MSLSKKLAVPIIFINLLMILSIYVAAESLIRGKFEEDYIQTIKEQAVTMEEVIEKKKTEAENCCTFFNNSARVLSALQNNDRKSMEKFAVDSMQAFNYDLFIVIREDGTLFYRSDKPESFGANMAQDYPPHLEAIQGELFSAAITMEDQAYVCAATPVYDNGGNIIASLTYAYCLTSESFVDEYGNMTDNDMTVFINRVRTMTTLLDDSGKRIVGTTLNDANVIEEVINKSNRYFGKTVIQERNYLCSYIPMESLNGDCIILFLGKDLTDVEATAFRVSRVIIVLIAGITVFSIMFHRGCHIQHCHTDKSAVTECIH